MSDELRRKVDLGERSLRLGVRTMQVDLWTKIAELAAEEDCDAVFERACFILEHLKNR